MRWVRRAWERVKETPSSAKETGFEGGLRTVSIQVPTRWSNEPEFGLKQGVLHAWGISMDGQCSTRTAIVERQPLWRCACLIYLIALKSKAYVLADTLKTFLLGHRLWR